MRSTAFLSLPEMAVTEGALVEDFVTLVDGTVGGCRGVARDQAIVVGHLVRIVKIGRRMVRDLGDGDGDQQFPLTRQYLDSYSSLVYLLQPEPTDRSRFDQYLKDSLVAELDLLRTVDEGVSENDRLLLVDLERALTTAEIAAEDVPGRRKIGWPSAEVRMRAVGADAYVAYRSGSNAVHGTWIDLLRAQLTVADDGTFAPDLRSEPFRPEVLRRFVRLGVPVIRLCLPVLGVDDPETSTALADLELRAGVA